MSSNNVIHQITELLHTHDCVVIPDFGGFIANYLSADFDLNAKTFSPPKRRVAFNEVLKFDDKVLSSYIAQKDEVQRDEAKKVISQFVATIRKTLASEQVFEFGEIGVFKSNYEGKLVFESNENYNFFAEGFGLVPINCAEKQTIVAPIEAKPQTELAVAESTNNYIASHPISYKKEILYREPALNANQTPNFRKRKGLYSFPVLALTVVLLAFVGYVAYKNIPTQQLSNKSSLNPADNYTPEVPKAKPVAPVDTLTKVQTPVKVEPTPIAVLENIQEEKKQQIESEINEPKKANFYIIAGAFATKKTALSLKNEFISKGFKNATLIMPKSSSEKYIKVAAASFNTEKEAYTQKQLISNKLHQSVWVLRSR